ncbi:MAG: putative 3 beta-hydroxysteroid dehydrogenase/Delta 5--_4-isomerase [Prokaryotic dsDNA virus sp.]|nr:MAG: putative 3 beta-hydroxysteroid dehydrogenase/Delta 5-->4-isomerase [Prokaryotic dsDNA virus sp.]|tara:strand:- start:1238 stop:2179 length:942 start_codon:yes stop_codon:yes gene_type:complete
MKVLVTGCAGFIGWNLTNYLLENTKYKVIGVDNYQGGGHNAELVKELKKKNKNFTFRRENFASTDLKGVEYIFHLGATPQVSLSVQNPFLTNENNVTNTLAMLEHARKEGVRKIIFSSSSAVYGDIAPTPTHEAVRCYPSSPYGLQKKIIEDYLILYHELYGMEFCILRYFNAYGPHQYSFNAYAGVIASFVKGFCNITPIRIDGDGEQSRDFVYVKDICKVNLGVVTQNVTGCLNVGSGMGTSINEVFDLISAITHHQPPTIKADKRQGDIGHSVANITRLKEIGYQPTELEKGLEITYQWYKKLQENGNSI